MNNPHPELLPDPYTKGTAIDVERASEFLIAMVLTPQEADRLASDIGQADITPINIWLYDTLTQWLNQHPEPVDNYVDNVGSNEKVARFIKKS